MIFAREKFFVATNEDEFLTKVIAHTQKRQIQNFLSLLSLCFHDNRRTTLLIRFETNFSILVALHIRVVINAAVLFLSSSHFENERVGERECREKREGIIILLRVMTEKRAKELQLDAKWEAAIDVSLRRIVYGAIGGTTLAMLMCRGTTARTAVAAFGIGIGVGSAYEDASKLFK